MSTKLRIAVALSTAGMINAAQAADDVYQLDDVVVTASRTAQSVDEALAPVTVITRQDIEQSQATDITELLKVVPGIQISRSGGQGSATSVFMRGASSSQTLVLVDGLRLNSATGGSAELQYIQPELIERIEVVRGPRSTLYGADAVGGVIQIFTRKGKGKPQFMVKAGAGSHKTNTLGINYGGKVGNTTFNIGSDFYESNGIDSTNDNNSTHKGVNLDEDAYRNKSLIGSISQSFNSDIEVGANFLYLEGKKEFDGYKCLICPPTDPKCSCKESPYQPETKFQTTTVNVYSVFPVNDVWSTRVDAGYSKQKSEQLGKAVDPKTVFNKSFYETERLSALWQNDIAWAENQLLTAGLDYYKDKADRTGGFNNDNTGKSIDSRYNAAVFLQNQSQFGGHDLQVALRKDKNESYGYHTTGTLAWGIELPKAIRLIASYGTAFRAPTFNDLYYPDSGNPNLKPETSQNYELELKGNHSIGRWSVSVFQNDIEDLIDWAPTSAGPWKPSNVDEARIQGIEASLATELQGWKLTGSVTLLNPKDTKTGKILKRRAKQFMSIDAYKQFGSVSIGGIFRAQGHSYDDSENTDRLAGFATIDLRTSLQVTKEIKAELKLNNLLDKEYQTAKGYNSEAKGGLVTVIWTPEL